MDVWSQWKHDMIARLTDEAEEDGVQRQPTKVEKEDLRAAWLELNRQREVLGLVEEPDDAYVANAHSYLGGTVETHQSLQTSVC